MFLESKTNGSAGLLCQYYGCITVYSSAVTFLLIFLFTIILSVLHLSAGNNWYQFRKGYNSKIEQSFCNSALLPLQERGGNSALRDLVLVRDIGILLVIHVEE